MAKLMGDPGWVGMDNAAKRVIGGRGDMSREQTRFASFFASMGLERGMERSGAKHVSNREHEAILKAACQAAQDERDGLAIERGKIAEFTVQLVNERDELAAARIELDAERARLRDEEQRLAAAVCAQDRTELAGALSALAEAADGLNPETRDSAISDMTMEANCEPADG